MKSCFELPEGYTPLLTVDLQKDKKLAVLVNVLAIVIAVIVMVPAMLWGPPIYTAFAFDSTGTLLAKMAVLLGGMVVYMVLHELVHGVFIRYYSGRRAKYGFTGMYAFAGSDAYFAKKPYIVIALAPIVVWGVVLAVVNILAPAGWFWIVYSIQIINLSGAAGDLYVTVRFRGLPDSVLVRDAGTSMTVYGR